MFFDKRSKTVAKEASETLEGAVQQELGAADAETVAIVTAIAGLLGSIAYADRAITEAERDLLVAALSGIQGLDERAAQAILRSLTRHIVAVSTLERPRFTRALVEFGDRELRYQVLSLLVDLAAADGTIGVEEVNMLRSITTALGLTQHDYNELQRRHRERLGSLR
ncbi:MAG TPA: TerB family tellurite resistance protein [Polyangiaceae bacterium]